MTTPSGFDIARDVTTNVYGGLKRAQDENVIESILSKSIQSGDPRDLQQSISTILSQVSPERQEMAIQYLDNAYKNVVAREKLIRDELRGRQAAAQAGYTYGVPDSVAAKQIEEKGKRERIGLYGLGGGQPEPSQQGQATSIEPQMGESNQVQRQKTIQDMSDEQISALIGAPDREIAQMAKSEQKRREGEKNRAESRFQADRKEQIRFHEETKDFDESLQNQASAAKKQLSAISDIEKSIDKVKPSSFASIFKGLGKVGQKISDAMLSGDQATIQASVPYLLEGWKEVFGVRLSDADLKVLEDKLPSYGKSRDANKAITNILRKYSELSILKNEIGLSIKKENKYLRPVGYRDMLEERFNEMTKDVKVINPNTGRKISIPAYKLSDALRSGAVLVNE